MPGLRRLTTAMVSSIETSLCAIAIGLGAQALNEIIRSSLDTLLLVSGSLGANLRKYTACMPWLSARSCSLTVGQGTTNILVTDEELPCHTTYYVHSKLQAAEPVLLPRAGSGSARTHCTEPSSQRLEAALSFKVLRVLTRLAVIAQLLQCSSARGRTSYKMRQSHADLCQS